VVAFVVRYARTAMSEGVFEWTLSRSRTLHESVLRGHVVEFEQLLSVGVDPNTYEGGQTPLHIAVRKCRYKFVLQLLAHGADTEATDGRGQTALVIFYKRHVVFGSLLCLPFVAAHDAHRALSNRSQTVRLERESRDAVGKSRVIDAEYTDISIVSPSGEVHLARVV